MLPRDSQFSTTPFVFPLFTLDLSHALSPPFIPFATFRPPFVFPRSSLLTLTVATALFPPSFPRRRSLYLIYAPAAAFLTGAYFEANPREAIIIVKHCGSKHCSQNSYNDINFIMKRDSIERYIYIYIYTLNYPFKNELAEFHSLALHYRKIFNRIPVK